MVGKTCKKILLWLSLCLPLTVRSVVVQETKWKTKTRYELGLYQARDCIESTLFAMHAVHAGLKSTTIHDRPAVSSV